jgi:hypothetical protein
VSLIVVGGIVFALLIATYSRRATWLALGSMMVSMAVLFGCLFLATIHDRNLVRPRLDWLASTLLLAFDRQMLDKLAASLEPAPSPLPCASGRPDCGSTQATPAPRHAEREAVQAAAASWIETEPDAKADLQSPVAWQLDERSAQLLATSPWGFSISATNVSDRALQQVQAVLKPDSAQREFALALDVKGKPAQGEAVIPAGARFSLVSERPEVDRARLGGAILSFRYVKAGQHKTSILYLTPAMLARFASRG